MVPAARHADIVPLHDTPRERNGNFHIDAGQSVGNESVLAVGDPVVYERLTAIHERRREQLLSGTVWEVRVSSQVPQFSKRFQAEADIAKVRAAGVVVVVVNVRTEDAIQSFRVVSNPCSQTSAPVVRGRTEATEVAEEHPFVGEGIRHEFDREDRRFASDGWA